MGPVISTDQQERVLGFLERAKDYKAHDPHGRGRPDGDRGFFVEPTVVRTSARTPRSSSARSSAPWSPCSASRTTTRRSHGRTTSRYGLSSSVWTRDVGRALNAARKLQFGTVWINDHIPLVSEMPHGGYKESGYGKDLSRLLARGLHADQARDGQDRLGSVAMVASHGG